LGKRGRVLELNIIATKLPGVFVLEPKVHQDHRGFFFELYNDAFFHDGVLMDPGVCGGESRPAVGKQPLFVQDNLSVSGKNVLRGLHYQKNPRAQGKLVQVLSGEVFDVAVDIRKDSPTRGQWIGEILSEANHRQLWIPAGFAHGFLTLSDKAVFLYKTTDYWSPKDEGSLLWNDPTLGIQWPLGGNQPVVSEKDAQAPEWDWEFCM
jgi:dTDP-4-dehydrorhamnose 3,5-epimerase